jgi:hypothetical protein
MPGCCVCTAAAAVISCKACTANVLLQLVMQVLGHVLRVRNSYVEVVPLHEQRVEPPSNREASPATGGRVPHVQHLKLLLLQKHQTCMPTAASRTSSYCCSNTLIYAFQQLLSKSVLLSRRTDKG